ncbi:pimeloyl-ACP methyl ester carboxylesterase [Motilibacter peucedani]|uniref:Pimeloyl-ACP methyl ester carboxylesterase n=1 Tax=Motilibacter peucedani TaxID=598650 RepID=A0A420XQL3_9ACTN|nr:epoxide hydrolase family protein [Motilibacter peucedani]RKS75583.1 pimeloyl-ACP methyl ester carboxylesterase [Motilibacter peucedani]
MSGAGESTVEPFPIQVPESSLEELAGRLRGTRWADLPADPTWSLGADPAYLRELVDYWVDGFDWRAQEAALGARHRVRVRIGDLRIHAVHVRAAAGAPRPLPLVLCHGWPDSSWRYEKVLDLLTDPGAHGGDPADAFDVVVPDMPGYGWSDAPGAPLDSIAVAGLWARLMTALGYERFGAVGGDIGSGVSRYLALDNPDRVVAVHRTDAGLPVPGSHADLSEEEQAWLQRVAAWGASEGAYAAMHRTKPDTAALGLTDSPVGLAAWIVEKLRAWSDCGGDVETRFTKDEILTNVATYWHTRTIGPSMRMYAENAAIPVEQHARRVEVPSGFALFPGDILRPPQAWLERTTNLVRLTEPAAGGHFAAFEVPELFAAELRDFFRPYRS